jgi:hypothetical protein
MFSYFAAHTAETVGRIGSEMIPCASAANCDFSRSRIARSSPAYSTGLRPSGDDAFSMNPLRRSERPRFEFCKVTRKNRLARKYWARPATRLGAAGHEKVEGGLPAVARHHPPRHPTRPDTRERRDVWLPDRASTWATGSRAG